MKADTLNDLLRYLVAHYPIPADLNRVRIMKLIYLIDWFGACSLCSQITQTKWLMDNTGPYSSDMYRAIKKDPVIKIVPSKSPFGALIEVFAIQHSNKAALTLPGLNDKEKAIVNQVIELTALLDWIEFNRYVNQLKPIHKVTQRMERQKLARKQTT